MSRMGERKLTLEGKLCFINNTFRKLSDRIKWNGGVYMRCFLVETKCLDVYCNVYQVHYLK